VDTTEAMVSESKPPTNHGPGARILRRIVEEIRAESTAVLVRKVKDGECDSRLIWDQWAQWDRWDKGSEWEEIVRSSAQETEAKV
jgi:hypothetical protein